jgi:hypothetical protein
MAARCSPRNGLAVKPSARKGLLLALLGLLVVAGVAWQAWRLAQPRIYTLKSATITKMDAERRTGEVEFVHPKSGQTMRVTAANIPPDCEISINGVPATLADVRVGDTVAVHGTLYADQTVKPDWVRVKRAAATTQPASASAPAGDQP